MQINVTQDLKAGVYDIVLTKIEGAIPPTIAPPESVPQFDERGLLKGGSLYGGYRVDPIVPAGTPRTVTIGLTGHVLSVARPDLGEMMGGYLTRVSAQAHGNPNIVGALMIGGMDTYFSDFGGFKADGSNWPIVADLIYNGKAATKADIDAWAAWYEAFKKNVVPNSPTPGGGNVPIGTEP